jgi:hypothetical protein
LPVNGTPRMYWASIGHILRSSDLRQQPTVSIRQVRGEVPLSWQPPIISGRVDATLKGVPQ